MRFLFVFAFAVFWGAFCSSQGVLVSDGIGKTILVVLPGVLVGVIAALLTVNADRDI